MTCDAVDERGCPICQSYKGRMRRTVEGWPLRSCANCGFLYAPRIRAETATELCLPSDYEPVWRARHGQVHRLLSGLLPAGELVVDVGAGFGALGLVAATAGRFRYIGFEPSQSVAAAARARGVELRAERFDGGSLDEKAGAVVLDNVIEHLADPVSLLAEAVKTMRSGGVLVVIVPNRYDVRQLVPSWRDKNHWIPPEHINYFSPASLGRVFESLGLQIHAFGFKALAARDWRYWPRAALETAHVYPFGLNVYGVLP